MLALLSKSTNPYFNIACEDFLLKNFKDEIFFIYRNDASLILGKHQNAFSEVNHRFVEKMKIPVVRRISGGGTVYHDPGNLNFCFITTPSPGEDLVDFKKHTSPIIASLATYGIEAKLGSRNELTVDGKKITGTACHVSRGRVLHHGTILYNANLDHLEESINGDIERYQDKAVKSVRSIVTNIAEKIGAKPDVDKFIAELFEKITNNMGGTIFDITKDQVAVIDKSIADKFNTWDWNYGYSPRFKTEVDISLDGTKQKVTVSVIKGYIKSVETEDENADSKVASFLIEKAFNPDGYKF